MPAKRVLTPADILPLERYGAERREHRRAAIEHKRARRVEVGPVACFYFESWQTMWHQVQEMLFIEKGGEAQVPDELAAYNALIPQGRELVATIMFEIEDPARRKALLHRLGGVEDCFFLEVAGEVQRGRPEHDTERTNAAGKASSVHFAHFPLSERALAAFKQPGTRVLAGCDHPAYHHLAALPEATRAALAEDLD